jgi:hypothetical protein
MDNLTFTGNELVIQQLKVLEDDRDRKLLKYNNM